MPSNREVAQRFIMFIDHPGGPRSPSGKQLSTISQNLGAAAGFSAKGPLFHDIAACTSYSTRVAVLMRNTYANRAELWLDPRTYSPTTARHTSEIRSAYDARCRTKGSTPHVFTVDPGYVNRAEPSIHARTITDIQRVVAQADKPRLQERTRYAALGTALQRIDGVLHLMTDGVPVPGTAEAHAQMGAGHDAWALTIAKLQAMRSIIAGFEALPLERMRPAVRAWNELINAKE